MNTNFYDIRFTQFEAQFYALIKISLSTNNVYFPELTLNAYLNSFKKFTTKFSPTFKDFRLLEIKSRAYHDMTINELRTNGTFIAFTVVYHYNFKNAGVKL